MPMLCKICSKCGDKGCPSDDVVDPFTKPIEPGHNDPSSDGTDTESEPDVPFLATLLCDQKQVRGLSEHTSNLGDLKARQVRLPRSLQKDDSAEIVVYLSGNKSDEEEQVQRLVKIVEELSDDDEGLDGEGFVSVILEEENPVITQFEPDHVSPTRDDTPPPTSTDQLPPKRPLSLHSSSRQTHNCSADAPTPSLRKRRRDISSSISHSSSVSIPRILPKRQKIFVRPKDDIDSEDELFVLSSGTTDGEKFDSTGSLRRGPRRVRNEE